MSLKLFGALFALAASQPVPFDDVDGEDAILSLLQLRAVSSASVAQDLAEPEFVMWANVECGACDPYPLIGAGGERFDSCTRETQLEVCGPVCGASDACDGWNYVESHKKCYYRSDTHCYEPTPNNDRDCYSKVITDTAGAVGDPHLTTNTGKHFDLQADE